MKTVFSSMDKVAHAWVYGDEDYSCRGGNIFGEGDKIYSYGHHFTIAKKMLVKGKPVVLMNNSYYSSSTSKHQSLVRQAIPYNWETIYVNDPSASSQSNIEVLLQEIKESLSKIPRARTKKEFHLRCANGYRETIHKLTAIGLKKDVKLSAGDKRLIAEPYSLETYVTNIAVYTKQKALNDKKRFKAEKKAKAERAIVHEQNIQKWLAGAINYLHQSWDEEILLRYTDGLIQTSGGVEITPSEVKELYRRLLAKEDVIGLKIEPYTVLAIDDSVITIGCHKIPLKSIFKLGKEIWKPTSK